MNLPESPSPLSLLSTLVTGVLVPSVAWLMRSGARLVKRVNQLDMRLRDRLKDLDRLSESHESSVVRMTKVEEAILAIQAQLARNDVQFSQIMLKLDQLPRVVALIENYSHALESIVPRNEVEARLRSAEERLRIVENDVRERAK